MDNLPMPSLCFDVNGPSLSYTQIMRHLLISGDPCSGKTSAAMLLLAQHIAYGGAFLYYNTEGIQDVAAQVLALSALGHSKQHLHHLRPTVSHPVKPYFIQPFLSQAASVLISPAGALDYPDEAEQKSIAGATLNLLSLKFLRSAVPSIPRMLIIDGADMISDRLLSMVLSRAKASGVAVIVALEKPEAKPMSVPALHHRILLKSADAESCHCLEPGALALSPQTLSAGQAYILQKGDESSVLPPVTWHPFVVPTHPFHKEAF